MIRFSLPGWPPSVNDSHFAKGRVLKPTTRLWMDQAYTILMGMRGKQKLSEHGPLGFELRLYGKWHNGNGRLRRSDLSNRIKLIEDVVAKVCSFDDSRVVILTAAKLESSEQHTEIDVWEIPDK